MTKTNRKNHVTGRNTGLVIETGKEQLSSSCKNAEFLEMCIKAHKALTQALAELKAKSHS